MAVLLLIHAECSRSEVLSWGECLAQALEEEFIVVEPTLARDQESKETLQPQGNSEEESDEQNTQRLIECSPLQFQTTVLEVIKEYKPSLILFPKVSRFSRTLRALSQKLDEQAACEILFFRPQKESSLQNPKVLVPASGGPHAQRALRLADRLVEGSAGSVTALYIEPDADDLATEVGEKLLGKILDKAGVDAKEHVQTKVIASNNISNGISQELEEGYDLMLLGSSNIGSIRKSLFGTIPDRMLRAGSPVTVGVLRAAKPITQRVREAFERILDLAIPQLSREERIQLFATLQTGSSWSFDFMALLLLSTSIAALGLIQNSTAVVIGAMLVAPLMVPLLGAGLAIVQGNFPLLRSSAFALSMGFMLSILVGFLLGLLVPMAGLTSELLSRGGPTLLDMGVAFLSGMAAAFCIARPNLSAALAGVAISAALVPPIATIGISLSLGEIENARGAALLFGTNVVAIIIGAAMALYAGGVRGKRTDYFGVRLMRRIYFGLIVVALALALPLGSVLLVHATRPVAKTVKVESTLYQDVRKLITAAGGTLSRVDTRGHGGATTVVVHYTTAELPQQAFANKLLSVIRKLGWETAQVELRPTLVIKGGATNNKG